MKGFTNFFLIKAGKVIWFSSVSLGENFTFAVYYIFLGLRAVAAGNHDGRRAIYFL